MKSQLPPRRQGLEGIPLDDDDCVTVGKVPVRGVGFRVGMQGAGKALIMSPAKARRFAATWRTPEAVAAELDWIAEALIEAADEIDAIPAEEQRRQADEMWATILAQGPRQ